MFYPPRHRARVLTAAATVIALGVGGLALAAEKESRLCRATIGNEASKVLKAGLKGADGCHKAKDKVCTANPPGSDREECNVVTSLAFDPKGKYAGQKTKSADKLQGVKGQCLAGDPVLANYPGGDIDALVFPFVDGEVSGSSSVLQGTGDLECDKVKTKCLQAIGKARSDVVNEIVKDAVKCQKALDKTGVTFGKLDSSCVATPAPKAGPKALAKIQKACVDEGLVGGDVGSCEPLPNCVVDNAKLTGLGLAPAIYSQAGATCGNGLIESSEQCDDGNATSGDGCSTSCELEGDTCDGGYAGPGSADGTRRAVVSISTPEPLGGIEINLDYPQFQAGIPGVGNSSLVNSRFTTLQTAGLAAMNDSGSDVRVAMVDILAGFTTGDLFRVDLDNCVSVSENVCNRNQNVSGCCFDPSSTSQFARCEDGTTVCESDADCTGIGGGECGGVGGSPKCPANPPSCGTGPSLSPPALGVCTTSGTPNGGCPGDNACVSQSEIMTCTVSNPSSLDGQPVAGVTCSVTITELP